MIAAQLDMDCYASGEVKVDYLSHGNEYMKHHNISEACACHVLRHGLLAT